MQFAKWVFRLSGISGVLIVLPPYFMEEQFGHDHPPAVNHPELYYGFFGVALAWQVMFLVISRDPIRYRLAMLPAMLEKASFVFAVPVLYALDRVTANWLGFAGWDGIWLVLFILAYLRTPKAEVSTPHEASARN